MGRSLPTLEKLEKKYGTIIELTDASELLGMHENALRYQVSRGYYQDACLVKNKDFEATSRSKYYFIKNRLDTIELPSAEEYEERNNVRLISLEEASEILAISPNTMRSHISQGLKKSLYITDGVDVKNTKYPGTKYLFFQDKVLEKAPVENREKLPSIEQLEEQLGTKLVPKHVASTYKSRFIYFDENSDEFKGTFVKNGVDFFDHNKRFKRKKPPYLFLLNKIHDASLPSVDEVKQKFGPLLHFHEAIKHFGCKVYTLNEILNRGYYRELYLKAGEDYRDTGRMKYLFFEKKIKNGINIRENFCGLEDLSKILNVNVTMMKRWSSNNLLDEARINGTLYEIRWVKENFLEIAQKNKDAIAVNNNFSPLALLEKAQATHLLSVMEEAVESFLKGGRFGKTKRKKRVKQGATKERYMRKLAVCMYRIICGRCGIDNYWEIKGPGKYRRLTDEEQKKFNPSVFEITDFNPEDIDFLAVGYEETTFFELMNHYFKPFIEYVLESQRKELRSFKKKMLGDRENLEENRKEYERLSDLLDLWEEDIEDAFDKTPQFKPIPKNERPDIHLNREQLLLVSKKIMNNLQFHDPLKRNTIFLLAGFTGIRNDEMCNLMIKDFALDEEGFLQRFECVPDKIHTTSNGISGPSIPTDNKYGYGLLFIRKEISKGEYGPSPEWGTYIAPGVVTVINNYLKMLYKKHPETRTEGYLFRSRDYLPFENYSSTNIGAWIREYREYLVDFLPKFEQKYFRYYDLRHSVAEIIVHQTHLKDPELEKRIERSAEFHIRHDMKNSSMKKSLLKKQYAKDATAIHYFAIMDEALNFPFNFEPSDEGIAYKTFYEWEITKGYRKPDIQVIEIEKTEETENQYSKEEIETIEEIMKEKNKKEAYLAEISKGYKRSFKKKFNLEENEWLFELPKTKKEIEALEKQIRELKSAGLALV